MDLMYYSGDREMDLPAFAGCPAPSQGILHHIPREAGDRNPRYRDSGETFYNGGTPIMLGVLSDTTPATEISPAGQHRSTKKIAHMAG